MLPGSTPMIGVRESGDYDNSWPSLLTILLFALLTALATGLGTTPFILLRRKHLAPIWLGVSTAVAAGMMSGTSVILLVEGSQHGGVVSVVLGAVVGALFVAISNIVIQKHDMQWGTLRGADARQVLLVMASMTTHSFAEGVSIGVSFASTESDLRFLVLASLALHNIPEGLAISAVLVSKGVSLWSSFWWSVFSSLPQPIMAVPAFVFVHHFRSVLHLGLGFAGGAMLWVVATELIPDARKHLPDVYFWPVFVVTCGMVLALM